VGKHKSPFTEEIFAEFDQLAFPTRTMSLKTKLRRWNEFFNKHVPGGSLKLSARDASLITVMGQSLLVQVGDYRRARQIGDMFLSLPDAPDDEVTYDLHLVANEIISILEGNSKEAVKNLRLKLSSPLSRAHIRNELMYAIQEIEDGSNTFHDVRALLVDLYKKWPGQTRVAKLISKATSGNQILSILEENRPTLLGRSKTPQEST
jgi:hypothetical protein